MLNGAIEVGGRYLCEDDTVSVVTGVGPDGIEFDEECSGDACYLRLERFRRMHSERLCAPEVAPPSPLPTLIPADAVVTRVDFHMPGCPEMPLSWVLSMNGKPVNAEDPRSAKIRKQMEDDLALGCSDTWDKGYDSACRVVLAILDGTS